MSEIEAMSGDELLSEVYELRAEVERLEGCLNRSEAQIHDDGGFIDEVGDLTAEVERLGAGRAVEQDEGERLRAIRNTIWEAFHGSVRLEACNRQDANLIADAVAALPHLRGEDV